MTRTHGKAPALRLLADNLASPEQRAAAVDLILDGKRLLTDDELSSLGIPVVDYVRTEYPPKSARFPKLADPFEWADDTNAGERAMGLLVLALGIFTGFMVTAFVVVRVMMWMGWW